MSKELEKRFQLSRAYLTFIKLSVRRTIINLALTIASWFVMKMVAIVKRSRIDFLENIFAYGMYERYAKPC